MTSPPRLTYLATLERVLVYIAVLSSPFRNLRFSGVFLTFSDLFYAASFFFLLVTGRLPAAPIGRSTQLWGLGFLMFIVGLMGSSIMAGSPTRGLIVVGQYLFAYIVLLFVLMRDDEAMAHRLATMFLAGMVIVDIHGIASFFLLGSSSGVVSGSNRLSTVLGNPNTAASINSLALPMLFYLWLSARMSARTALFVLAVILTTVVLTSSNTGVILVVLGSTIYLVAAGSGRAFWRFAIVAMGCAVFLLIIGIDALPETFRGRVLSSVSSGDLSEAGTLVSRIELMREAVAMIQQREIVLVGVGADQFRELSKFGAPVHNTYLLVMTEGGAIALFGWFLMIVIGLRVGLAVRLSGADPNLGAMVIATFVVFAVGANTHAHIYARYYLTPLILCLSIAMIELRRRAARYAQERDLKTGF